MEKSWICSQVIPLDFNNVKNLKASEKKEREGKLYFFFIFNEALWISGSLGKV